MPPCALWHYGLMPSAMCHTPLYHDVTMPLCHYACHFASDIVTGIVAEWHSDIVTMSQVSIRSHFGSMGEDSIPNLSFLRVAMDTSDMETDDVSGGDGGGAPDVYEDINVTLSRALAAVTPDMCTATTEKVPPGLAEQPAVLVHPSLETKHVEPMVSRHPSQQGQSLGCLSGAPAAAMEEQVRLVTSEGNKQVATNPDTWSMQPVPPSSSAAAVASESENVAAAAMGAMVPRSPLQKHLPELQIRTRAAFEEDFDECLNMTGKKKMKLGEGAEGVVKAVLHRATGTLRAVKWCKRAALQSEVDLLHRMARTTGARSFDLVHF